MAWTLTKDAAILIDEAQAFVTPTFEEREAFLQRQEQDIHQQKERTLAQQQEQRERIEAKLRSDGGNGALERRRARQAAKGQVDAPAVPEMPASEALERLPYVHYTPGPSTTLPGYRPCTQAMAESGTEARVNAYTSLQEAYQAGVWTYPETLEQRARCAVFEDLHERGYFMSTGLRFGGDFVVYPGDPLRYHSHYTAAVLATPEQPMAAYHIVASGRLGTAVKKSHLLCQANTRIVNEEEARERRIAGLDDTNERWGDVEYWSLAWAGFGT